VGFDQPAIDLRKVPLVVNRINSKGASQEFSSFALETVDAYERTTGIHPLSKDLLKVPIADHAFVYTTFLPQKSFSHVSAADLLQDQDAKRKSDAMKRLERRIVLIGGNRHTRRGGSEWLDNHVLPPLKMRGMYFHANYIEGLLDDRIKSPVRRWIAFGLDVLTAVLMIRFSSRAKSLVNRIGLLLVFFVPVSLTYVASINLGYVLDFVLPLLLLFLHAFVENYVHSRLARSRKEPVAHAY
jgi:CHASE2 domain-containing sensor protein